MTVITTRIKKDKTVVQIMPDGKEIPLGKKPMRKMSFEEIEAAALTDPDNLPQTDEQLANMNKPALVKRVRRKLGLSQAAFSEKFNIPIGTLRDWEQRRCQPDKTARAYIAVIAYEPDAVKRALSYTV